MAEWIETFKGAVLASEYDAQTHMNSPMYVSRFDQATWFLLHAIGVTPASVRQRNLRVAIVRQNYQYLAELRGGELVVVESGFVALGTKHVRFIHRMIDCETGRMLASSDCTAVLASLETGKSIPLPEDFLASAKECMVSANVEEAVPQASPDGP